MVTDPTLESLQQQLEALYAERLGKDALKAFKARYFKVNPERQKATDKMLSQLTGVFKGEEKPLSEQEVAELKGKDLHPLLYQGLLKHEQIGDDFLQALAKQRAQAIVDEMVVVNKVARERVQSGKVEPLEGDGKRVGIKLSLVVAAAPAAPTEPEPSQGTVISTPDAKPQAAP